MSGVRLRQLTEKNTSIGDSWIGIKLNRKQNTSFGRSKGDEICLFILEYSDAFEAISCVVKD